MSPPRAIVRQPALFLMDEPLSDLDTKLRVSTPARLKKLHPDPGVTTVYVTHDQVEAMTLADHVVVTSKGRIQQAGTPARSMTSRPTCSSPTSSVRPR